MQLPTLMINEVILSVIILTVCFMLSDLLQR
jgi:hypothetical protein